ncbi:MAG: DUF6949 family protein [Rhizomicrobium sp.]
MPQPVPDWETGVLHDSLVAIFALAAGFTASGIVANTYRLLVKKADGMAARVGYFAVMVIAGPSVLIDNAARSWRKKACSATAFWLAAAVSSYWSFALGLFVLEIALSLRPH